MEATAGNVDDAWTRYAYECSADPYFIQAETGLAGQAYNEPYAEWYATDNGPLFYQPSYANYPMAPLVPGPLGAFFTSNVLQQVLSASETIANAMRGLPLAVEPMLEPPQASVPQQDEGWKRGQRLRKKPQKEEMPKRCILASRIKKKPVRRAQTTDQTDEALADLEKLCARFHDFRMRRGFAQADVGEAMGHLFGVPFSQTTISRFEAVNLSFKNMCKFRPLIMYWMNHVRRNGLYGLDYIKNHNSGWQDEDDDALEENLTQEDMDTVNEFLSLDRPPVPEPDLPMPRLRLRRRRTELTVEQRQYLLDCYHKEDHPTDDQLRAISAQMQLDFCVVKVWFANWRARERRSMRG
ncbi:Oct-1 transcription factor [Aphelenchoides avenae]|nr:Oct-1 transcription factor [Aphelenchus avenae]